MEPGNDASVGTQGHGEVRGPTTHQWINPVIETTTVAIPLTHHRFEEEKNIEPRQHGRCMTRGPTMLFSPKNSIRMGAWNVRMLNQGEKCQ